MINVVIDVSHHNGPNIDFAKVKAAGIVGVIHKATAVSNFKDKMYPVNRARALAAGLLWGAYHWGVGDAEAEDQVNYFLDYAQPTAQSLLALDSEPNLASAHRLGPDMSPEQATEFVTSINGRFDRFPLLYTGHAMEGRESLRLGPIARCGNTRTDTSGRSPMQSTALATAIVTNSMATCQDFSAFGERHDQSNN